MGVANKAGQNSNNQKPVNSASSTNHKVFNSEITLIHAKHGFDLPTVGVVSQDRLIRKFCVRAKICPKRLLIAEVSDGIGQQDHGLPNLIERALIPANHIRFSFIVNLNIIFREVFW